MIRKKEKTQNDFSKRKDRAFHKILARIPGASVTDIDTTPITRVQSGGDQLFFVPLDDDLYAFKIEKNEQESGPGQNGKWSIGNLGTVINVLGRN